MRNIADAEVTDVFTFWSTYLGVGDVREGAYEWRFRAPNAPWTRGSAQGEVITEEDFLACEFRRPSTHQELADYILSLEHENYDLNQELESAYGLSPTYDKS